MANIGQRLRHELANVLPPTIFFLAAFALLLLTESLILRQYAIPFSGMGPAVIGALIVGKVVLVVDNLPFVKRLPGRRRIYAVLWKTAIYLAAVMAVRYVEHAVEAWLDTRDLWAAQRLMLERVVWPHFWLVQIWLAVLMLAFCTARECVRALGADAALRLLFGASATPGADRTAA